MYYNGARSKTLRAWNISQRTSTLWTKSRKRSANYSRYNSSAWYTTSTSTCTSSCCDKLSKPSTLNTNNNLHQNHIRQLSSSSIVDDNDSHQADDANKKSIEQIYTRLSNNEHILLRPGMYVGSTDAVTSFDWTYDAQGNAMGMQELIYSPALIKIVDEILVNACDQRVRGAGTDALQISWSGCNTGQDIYDGADPNDSNIICIENNGSGIPIEIHAQTGEYLPQMLFGSLYTGSNFFDDDNKQVVGGRHGYGAKLTNLFSMRFTLETVCDGVYYKQTWSDNMNSMSEPEIDSIQYKQQDDFTRITFQPDLKRFDQGFGEVKNDASLIGFSEHVRQVFLKRCVDVAGTSGLKVTINGAVLPVQGWQE